MSAGVWIAIIAGGATIIGAILGYARSIVTAPLIAENAKVEAEKAGADSARSDAERRSARDRERLADIETRYKILRQDMINLKLGKTSVFLKHEIDIALLEATEALDVIESSILVPGPVPNSSSFVFLSINGPAAAKLRLAKLEIGKGIVGRVFSSGKLHNTTNPYGDPNFFPGIDKKGGHETQTMLTVPLNHDGRTIGVAQFLNKPDGFSEADEITATELAGLLTVKVATFVRDPENFELLGLAGKIEDREATIAFCDLTSSSSLLEQMNTANAVDCINEYLEQQCDVAMRHGATVDKYLGDGAMLLFVAARSTDGDHVAKAVEAAIEMQDHFRRLKEGWMVAGLPMNGIYNRIGISCGKVHDAKLGHPQFQEITVIGEAVNEAAALCEGARRDDDVIVIPEHLVGRLKGRFAVKKVDSRDTRLRPHEVLEAA